MNICTYLNIQGNLLNANKFYNMKGYLMIFNTFHCFNIERSKYDGIFNARRKIQLKFLYRTTQKVDTIIFTCTFNIHNVQHCLLARFNH